MPPPVATRRSPVLEPITSTQPSPLALTLPGSSHGQNMKVSEDTVSVWTFIILFVDSLAVVCVRARLHRSDDVSVAPRRSRSGGPRKQPRKLWLGMRTKTLCHHSKLSSTRNANLLETALPCSTGESRGAWPCPVATRHNKEQQDGLEVQAVHHRLGKAAATTWQLPCKRGVTRGVGPFDGRTPLHTATRCPPRTTDDKLARSVPQSPNTHNLTKNRQKDPDQRRFRRFRTSQHWRSSSPLWHQSLRLRSCLLLPPNSTRKISAWRNSACSNSEKSTAWKISQLRTNASSSAAWNQLHRSQNPRPQPTKSLFRPPNHLLQLLDPLLRSANPLLRSWNPLLQSLTSLLRSLDPLVWSPKPRLQSPNYQLQ